MATTATTGQFSRALAAHCEAHERAVVPLVAQAAPLALDVCRVVAEYVRPSDAEFAARAFAGEHSYTFCTGAWRIGYSEGGVLFITFTCEDGFVCLRVVVQELAELDAMGALIRRDYTDNDRHATLLAARAAELLESRLQINAKNPLIIV
jgi:hypothetical protein